MKVELLIFIPLTKNITPIIIKYFLTLEIIWRYIYDINLITNHDLGSQGFRH